MYERLSTAQTGVVKLAHDIAREYDQEYVGTEHILLAITCVKVRASRCNSWNGTTSPASKLKDQVDQLVKRVRDAWVSEGGLPGTPHFRNVVAHSHRASPAVGIQGGLHGASVAGPPPRTRPCSPHGPQEPGPGPCQGPANALELYRNLKSNRPRPKPSSPPGADTRDRVGHSCGSNPRTRGACSQAMPSRPQLDVAPPPACPT